MARDRLELDKVWVIAAKRLNNSVNGNPRWDVTFTDGKVGSWTYRTSSDSMCNYDVENLLRSKELVDVYVTRADRVCRIERRKAPFS